MCLYGGFKNRIVTCEKCMFCCEKGYKRIGVIGSCKTYYYSRAIQQINFMANLDRAGNTKMFFIIEEAKETFFGLFTRNRRSFANAISLNAKCNLIFISIKWQYTTV